MRRVVLALSLLVVVALPALSQSGLAIHFLDPALVDRVSGISSPSSNSFLMGTQVPRSARPLKFDRISSPPSLVSSLVLQEDQETPQACDTLGGTDKIRHVIISFSMNASIYWMIKEITGVPKGTALLLSTGVSAGIGLLKEFTDRNGPKQCFSTGDLLANTLGVFLAGGLILVL